MKWLCILLLILSVSSKADIRYQYQPVDQNLSVSGLVCEYGRASKTLLPQLALNYIHNELLTEEVAFIKQIKNVSAGMAGNRLERARLALFYQLTLQNLAMDYYFEGNNACAQFNGSLILDFDQDFAPYISLTSPADYSFVSGSEPQQIFAQLTQVYPDLSESAAESEYLVLVEQITPQIGLYRFAYQAYNQALKTSEHSYFVKGDDLLTKALIEYLNSHGYTPTELSEQAHWQLSIHYHNGNEFTVDFYNTPTSSTSLNSEHVLSLDMTGETEREKINLLTLKLELMNLAELLQ